MIIIYYDARTHVKLFTECEPFVYVLNNFRIIIQYSNVNTIFNHEYESNVNRMEFVIFLF